MSLIRLLKLGLRECRPRSSASKLSSSLGGTSTDLVEEDVEGRMSDLGKGMLFVRGIDIGWIVEEESNDSNGGTLMTATYSPKSSDGRCCWWCCALIDFPFDFPDFRLSTDERRPKLRLDAEASLVPLVRLRDDEEGERGNGEETRGMRTGSSAPNAFATPADALLFICGEDAALSLIHI